MPPALEPLRGESCRSAAKAIARELSLVRRDAPKSYR